MKVPKYLVPLLAVLFHISATWNHLSAQPLTVFPENPTNTDTLVFTFNAAEGNKALMNYNEAVYFHAGLITAGSTGTHDWKMLVGVWGKHDERTKMEPLGNDLYQFVIHPQSFFNIPETTVVQQFAFVFRNENGTLVAKTTANEDFLVPVNGYEPDMQGPGEMLVSEKKYVSHTSLGDDALLVNTDQGDLTVRIFDKNIVEVAFHPNGFNTYDSSHAVIMKPKGLEFQVLDNPAQLSIRLPEMMILVEKEPVRLHFFQHDALLLSEEVGFFEREHHSGFRFQLADGEKLYGTGERATGMNLRGEHLGLYNRPHYGYELGAKDLNFVMPVVLSSNRYMILLDNPQRGYLDMGHYQADVLEFGTIGGEMKYYLIASDTYAGLLKDYSRLTGFQPMTPRWALGNLQSRMAYKTQEETTHIVNQMIAEDFPIDAIIIDFYWFGDSIMGHMGRLDWFWQNWPDPVNMIEDFRNKGVKTILITEPYIIDTLENFTITSGLGLLATDTLGNTYVNREFYFGDAGLIDIFKPEAALWWWQQYVPQIENGVAGWWGDLGEPESHPSDMQHVIGMADEVHNIYGHYWHKMIWDNYREHYPELRLFNLNRSGFAGSQRYGVYPWTGDVARSWGGLQAQLPAMLHMSMSGLPFIHADAGGFAMGEKDDELYTRWLQFAVFTPVLRPHGSGIPSEPIYFNDTTKRIVRHFMKLRHALMPYIYTMSWENSQTGLPLVKPMFFYHDDDQFAAYDQSYYFGRDLLVSPVLNAGQEYLDVPLPAGLWYNYFTGEAAQGGVELRYRLRYETIPVFARAGSIIPHVEAVNSTDYYSSRRLYLRTYLPEGETGLSGIMYEDDGWTFGAYENGDYELFTFNGEISVSALNLNISRHGNGYAGMPESRLVEWVFYGLDKPVKTVVADGREIVQQSPDLLHNDTGFWLGYDGLWRLRLPYYGHEQQIIIKF
jgi:oligosaccharide 4-alpha-D-glucosyltransferase